MAKKKQKRTGPSSRRRKRAGKGAALLWIPSAEPEDVLAVAGSELSYQETLNDLRLEGMAVPRSSDPNFSWGFCRKVRGWVINKIHKAQRSQPPSADAPAQTAKSPTRKIDVLRELEKQGVVWEDVPHPDGYWRFHLVSGMSAEQLPAELRRDLVEHGEVRWFGDEGEVAAEGAPYGTHRY